MAPLLPIMYRLMVLVLVKPCQTHCFRKPMSSHRLTAGNESRCRYTKIPATVRGPHSTPSQLTCANMDKSAMLPALFGNYPGNAAQRILAELQLAFLTFLFGKSLEGAECVRRCTVYVPSLLACTLSSPVSSIDDVACQSLT
jgi:AAR2 protein